MIIDNNEKLEKLSGDIHDAKIKNIHMDIENSNLIITIFTYWGKKERWFDICIKTKQSELASTKRN